MKVAAVLVQRIQLLPDNDAVPISLWCGGHMRFTEYP